MRALVLLAPLVLVGAAAAAEKPKLPPPDPLQLLNTNSLDAFAGNLRGYLVRNVPPTLYEASPGWGNMKYVTRGVEWHGQGSKIRPERKKSHENDGTWKKVRLTADNLPNTLIFDLRNVQWPEPGRMTFDAYLSFDARIEYDHQVWDEGRRLYAGSTRARFRVKLLLCCEATTRLEPNGGLLPDAVFRLRAARAKLDYDNFETEHAAGVGGELARLLGDAARSGLREWRPSVEAELFRRADAAIVKAADTREIRVNLTHLFARRAKAR